MVLVAAAGVVKLSGTLNMRIKCSQMIRKFKGVIKG